MAEHSTDITYVSLCTGGGGLDRGFELAVAHLGRRARPVLYVEREAFAAAVLVDAIRTGLMAPAPVWSDAKTIDSQRLRGCVDFVIGGIPCQGNSLAGKRKLADDERDLWEPAWNLALEVGAGGIIIENVFGLLVPDRKGQREAPLRRMLRDVAAAGWDAEWCCLPASAVGAAHRRERVFFMAYRAGGRLGELRQPPRGDGQPDGCGEELADSNIGGLRTGVGSDDAGQHDALGCGAGVGDATGTRCGRRTFASELAGPEARGTVSCERSRQLGDAGCELAQGRGQRAPAVVGVGCAMLADAERDRAGHADADYGQGRVAAARASVLPLFAPGPSDTRWPGFIALAPEVEPAVRELADGLASVRRDWLRLLGNGVVELQAAAAIVALFDAAGE